MKAFLPVTFLLLSMLLMGPLSAQITITSASLPNVGDTLFAAVDGFPDGVDVKGPGQQEWSFLQLQGLGRETVLLPASFGSAADSFPAANIVELNGNIGENYFQRTADDFIFVGYTGTPFLTDAPDFQVVVPLDPPLPQIETPIRYQDEFLAETNVSLPFDADSLPQSLLDLVQITPDSVRLRINIQRKDQVNAFGKLQLLNESFDVLRVERIEKQDVRVDVKLDLGPFSSWQDITDFISDQVPEIGQDSFLTYYFLTEGLNMPVATVSVDPVTREVLRVEYKADRDMLTSATYINTGHADIVAYPNPAINEVRFDLFNLHSGRYKVTLFNILGVSIEERSYQIAGSKTVKFDISKLRKGTYLYSLTDSQGKTLATKRLIIIRP